MKNSLKSVLLVLFAAVAVSALPVEDTAQWSGGDGVPESVHEKNGEIYDSSSGQWLVKQYGQCGGQYYQGSYQCNSGFACHYKNQDYSQCY